MWSIKPIVENGIHVPDLSSMNFHCLAKTEFSSPPPEHYVRHGVMHPTIQFKTLDMFKYPFVHVKARWVDRPEGQGDVVWDAIYRMPPKTSLANVKPGAGFVMSSLGWNAELVKNLLKPGGVSWVHMKTLCIPPDSKHHRLLLTVTPTNSDQNDVLGGPIGMGVYNVKHFFGNYYHLHQLNKGLVFL